jgi:hypothetical protein
MREQLKVNKTNLNFALGMHKQLNVQTLKAGADE